ncbi:MAG: hypothetical protein WKF31_02130 [Thermoleophilaceae bacterium]
MDHHVGRRIGHRALDPDGVERVGHDRLGPGRPQRLCLVRGPRQADHLVPGG